MNTYLTGALLLAMSSAVMAQSYEKNDLPCVAEVCLGDGLDDLAKVTWDRARGRISFGGKPNYVDGNKLTAAQLSGVKQSFRGTLEPAAAYLSYEAFDNKALPLLPGVTAACSRKELTGTYTTKSGNPTSVYLALFPGALDPAKQSWRVVKIIRKFPETKTTQQKADVQQQLRERYGKFKARMPPSTANFDTKTEFDGVTLQLWMYGGLKEHDLYMAHPACGGTKKPKID